MARKTPSRIPLERDPRALTIAWRYSRLLAARHGAEFPALVEISQRIDEALDKVLALDGYENRAVFMHGRARKQKDRP